MRLLHVIDRIGHAGLGDWAALACHAVVRGAPAHEHVVALVGSGADERRAESLGLTTPNRINPAPAGWSAPGVRALARHRGPFDRVLIWSSGVRRPHRIDNAVRLLVCPSGSDAGQEDADQRSIFLDDFAARELAPLRPPMGIGRGRVRSHLGLRDSDVVVALAGHAGDSRAASIGGVVVGLVEASGRSIVGLIPASPSNAGRVRRLLHPPGVPTRLVFTDLPECLAIVAADVVIVAPRAWRLAPGDDDRCEVSASVLAGACTIGRGVVAPESQRSRNISDHFEGGVEFALNSVPTEMARALVTTLERRSNGPTDPKPDDVHAFERFATRVIERLNPS